MALDLEVGAWGRESRLGTTAVAMRRHASGIRVSSEAGEIIPVRIDFAISSVLVCAPTFSFSFWMWKRTVDSEMYSRGPSPGW